MFYKYVWKIYTSYNHLVFKVKNSLFRYRTIALLSIEHVELLLKAKTKLKLEYVNTCKHGMYSKLEEIDLNKCLNKLILVL